MEQDYQKWLWESIGTKCVENLKKNGFDAHFVQSKEEANDLILRLISSYQSFGFGGSSTTRELGIVEVLQSRGKTVFDHWQKNLSPEQDMTLRRNQLQADCFFCSANAISVTGEIVNVDGVGNRTSAMAFGPKKVVIIAGMNKVTHDLESALRRIKEVAAPMRAKSLQLETPCAKTGVCADCHVPQRICRITTILHRKPAKTDISVVLINKSFGF